MDPTENDPDNQQLSSAALIETSAEKKKFEGIKDKALDFKELQHKTYDALVILDSIQTKE